jgi:quercetin dioxygenase-like cupin family protein
MVRRLSHWLLSATLFAAGVCSGQQRPVPITPDALRWASPPALPGVQGAWAVGSEDKAGPYVFRVKLASGARIPPHTHPDQRITTVLKGVLHVGFGETFEPDAMVAISAGGIYVAPAGVPHYLWARNGDAEYQESGQAPTGTRMLERRP